MQIEDPNGSRYGQIIEDTKTVLRMFRSWKVCHVKRDANGAAHGLAKQGVKTPMNKVWIEEIPQAIFDIVTLERLQFFIL